MITMVRTWWDKLSPRFKRYSVMGGGIVILGVISRLFMGESAHTDRTSEQQAVIRHVLTDRNTRELGIESVSADVKRVTQDTQNLQREFEQLKQKMEVREKNLDSKAAEISDELRREFAKLGDPTRNVQESKQVTESSWRPLTDQLLDTREPSAVFEQNTVSVPLPKGERTSSPPVQIIHHAQAQPPAKSESPAADDTLYLPAGSLLSGVTLTGLDAPTHQGARREPFPAAVRIQKEAILPNHFRADVRECFLIVSGYGDLSSERAYLRGETLSCVREDGGVVESRLDAYAVGEDGKAGVRGRLVSKQGQIIAKSMMAGFLSGMSKAFDINPIPVISTTPTTNTPYQQVFSNDLFQGAAVKGASQALDRVAKFYIDMAENIFPVIEVDAGRRIDMVITHGAPLRLRMPTATPAR